MATSAERKALIFLAAVVCLGAGARIARSRGDAALAAAGGRGRKADDGGAALAAQISAVDSARAGLSGPPGARPARRKATGRARRRAAGDSAPPDTFPPDSAPISPRRRSRARATSVATPPASQPVDGWALRPVETTLAPGGFGVVRAGPQPPPDTAPSHRPRRRRPK